MNARHVRDEFHHQSITPEHGFVSMQICGKIQISNFDSRLHVRTTFMFVDDLSQPARTI
jgi:hypothetical protein